MGAPPLLVLGGYEELRWTRDSTRNEYQIMTLRDISTKSACQNKDTTCFREQKEQKLTMTSGLHYSGVS
jgi:hypothetical protein